MKSWLVNFKNICVKLSCNEHIIFVCKTHIILFKISISIIGLKLTCKNFISFPGSFSLTVWKILMKTERARKLILELSEIILKTFNPTFLEIMS